MVDLEETIDMMPEELSGGMSRRVSIARTMIYQPDLILYDEPTTGLDPLAARNIIELINRLKHDRHVTSIIVSHAIEDVASLADRFVVIRSGDVVWAADREEFLARKEAIVSAFYH
jgi:phospholipid/cholesterol/gamma-HCH transport system ATP-binding protein